MKRIVFYVFFISISIFMFIGNIQALTSPNGIDYIESGDNDNTFALYCKYYNDSWILIDRGSTEDSGNIDSNGHPNEFRDASNETLKKYGFMNSSGSRDCPLFVKIDNSSKEVIGYSNSLDGGVDISYIGLNVSASSCTGRCNGNQNSNVNDYWTCNYTGPSGSLVTQYSGVYSVYYPDGSHNSVSSSLISSSCPDIFYNKKTKEMKMATYDYAEYIKNHNNFDPKQHDYLCGSNRSDYEYYCSGECKYPGNKSINCEELTDRIEGITVDLGDICNNPNARQTMRFIGYLLLIAKILVPVLLIVFGIIDFSKALMSSNTDALQKSGQSLIFRIIAGIVIFLIPTIVNFFFKVIVRTDVFRYEECRVCIFDPRNCN